MRIPTGESDGVAHGHPPFIRLLPGLSDFAKDMDQPIGQDLNADFWSRKYPPVSNFVWIVSPSSRTVNPAALTSPMSGIAIAPLSLTGNSPDTSSALKTPNLNLSPGPNR
jgi:hypothetical protein